MLTIYVVNRMHRITVFALNLAQTDLGELWQY